MHSISQLIRKQAVVVPVGLTTLRLVLGPFALWWACSNQNRIGFLFILLTGLLSDIFDGVLARKLGVSTPAIRRYDSATDLTYYLFIAAAAWDLEHALISRALPWIGALLISEASCIAVSLMRFRCFPATHSWLAKIYGLVLFVTFTGVLCSGGPAWLIPLLAIVGLTANAEILLILCMSKQAPVDVLTLAKLKVSKF